MRNSQTLGVINSLVYFVSVGKLHNCPFVFFCCSENDLHRLRSLGIGAQIRWLTDGLKIQTVLREGRYWLNWVVCV